MGPEGALHSSQFSVEIPRSNSGWHRSTHASEVDMSGVGGGRSLASRQGYSRDDNIPHFILHNLPPSLYHIHQSPTGGVSSRCSLWVSAHVTMFGDVPPVAVPVQLPVAQNLEAWCDRQAGRCPRPHLPLQADSSLYSFCLTPHPPRRDRRGSSRQSGCHISPRDFMWP